jgi:hypothetical protein
MAVNRNGQWNIENLTTKEETPEASRQITEPHYRKQYALQGCSHATQWFERDNEN